MFSINNLTNKQILNKTPYSPLPVENSDNIIYENHNEGLNDSRYDKLAEYKLFDTTQNKIIRYISGQFMLVFGILSSLSWIIMAIMYNFMWMGLPIGMISAFAYLAMTLVWQKDNIKDFFLVKPLIMFLKAVPRLIIPNSIKKLLCRISVKFDNFIGIPKAILRITLHNITTKTIFLRDKKIFDISIIDRSKQIFLRGSHKILERLKYKFETDSEFSKKVCCDIQLTTRSKYEFASEQPCPEFIDICKKINFKQIYYNNDQLDIRLPDAAKVISFKGNPHILKKLKDKLESDSKFLENVSSQLTQSTEPNKSEEYPELEDNNNTDNSHINFKIPENMNKPPIVEVFEKLSESNMNNNRQEILSSFKTDKNQIRKLKLINIDGSSISSNIIVSGNKPLMGQVFEKIASSIKENDEISNPLDLL